MVAKKITMKKMITKLFRLSITLLLGLLVVGVTMQAAMATDENISAGDSYMRKLTNGDVVTYNNAEDSVICIGSNGVYDEINISPYSAAALVRNAGTPAPNGFLDENSLIYVCSQTTKTLCIVRCTTGSFNTNNLSSVWHNEMEYITSIPAPYAPNGSTTHAFTYDTNGFGATGFAFVSTDFELNVTWPNNNAVTMCGQNRKNIDLTDVACSENYWSTLGGNLILTRLGAYFDRHGLSQSGALITQSWYINSTHFFPNASTYSSNAFPQAQNDYIDQHSFCWEDDENYWCKGLTAASLAKITKDDVTDVTYNNTFIRGGSTFGANFYEADDGYELFMVGSNLYLYYEGELVNNDYNITGTSTYSQYFFDSLINNNIIYTTNITNKRILTVGTFAGNQTVNGTYNYPELLDTTDLPSYTTIELTTETIIDDDKALIGGNFDGQDKILLLNITNQAFLILSEADVSDTVYSISVIGDTIYAGTNNDLYTYIGISNNSLTEIATQGYGGIIHTDKFYDVKAKNSTSAFNCDHNPPFWNEPDYYQLGAEPVGSYGGGCYDIEYDNTTDYLYVDADEDGINVYNVSNPYSFTYSNTYDFRTSSHGYDYGDLLDRTTNTLIAKDELNSMIAYNTTNPEALTAITACNNGGIGAIHSVEIYDDETILGGTENGRMSVCDITNNDSETNTNWYTLTGMNGEDIQAIEQTPDGRIFALGTSTIGLYDILAGVAENNTPPTLDSYTISETELAINQTTDITITAGNIEAADVIYYGIKCDENETDYTFNTNGQHTCTYNESGVYYITIAVTDNYHYPDWYDATNIIVTVSEDVFTGGILRIQVLNEDHTEAITGATIIANNETKSTDSEGRATFITDDTGPYEVMTSKAGYYTDYSNFYADSTTHVITLVTVGTGTDTILEVTVIDADANPVENALVTYTNTISYEYDYDFTNALGLAIFKGLDAGSVIIQASKEDQEASTSATIGSNETTQITLTLQAAFAGTTALRDDRNCRDDGIWLCGDVDNACTDDSECLSDQCTAGYCSRFNYSVCDENGYARGQSCVINFTTQSWLGSMADWILSNLLYVLLLIVVAIGIGFIIISWRKN